MNVGIISNTNRKRDFIVIKHWFFTNTPRPKYVLIVKSIDYENAPPVDQDTQRGTIFYGGYIIEPKDNNPAHSEVTYISFADIKLVPEVDSGLVEKLFTKYIQENALKIFHKLQHVVHSSLQKK